MQVPPDSNDPEAVPDYDLNVPVEVAVAIFIAVEFIFVWNLLLRYRVGDRTDGLTYDRFVDTITRALATQRD